MKHEHTDTQEELETALFRAREAIDKATFPAYFKHMQEKIYPLIQDGEALI